jgi:hypothetical protein
MEKKVHKITNKINSLHLLSTVFEIKDPLQYHQHHWHIYVSSFSSNHQMS